MLKMLGSKTFLPSRGMRLPELQMCRRIYPRRGLYSADRRIVQRASQEIGNGSAAAEAYCPDLQVTLDLVALNIVTKTAQNVVGSSLEAVMVAAEFSSLLYTLKLLAHSPP